MASAQSKSPRGAVLAVGGANRDEVMRLAGPLTPGASNPVRIKTTAGGIARNVAQNLVALGVKTQLLTVVGDDEAGDWLLARTRLSGVDTSPAIRRAGLATGRYVAVLDPGGELTVGLADMAAAESLTPADIETASGLFGRSGTIFADANLRPETLVALFDIAAKSGSPVTIDLVSPAKATRLPADLSSADLVVGNRREAMSLLGIETPPANLATAIVDRGAYAAVISDGDGPVYWCGKTASGYDCGSQSPPVAKVVDVTGAGDALHAGIIAARRDGASLADAVSAGLKIAARIVSSSAHALTPPTPLDKESPEP